MPDLTKDANNGQQNSNLEESSSREQRSTNTPVSTLTHSANVDYAVRYGLEEALMIHHFQYWIDHNCEMGRNLIDGRTWTYQTLEEIAAHFRYWSVKQVRRIISSLESQGVILKANHNKSAHDQTVWYAFQDECEFLSSQRRCPNGQLGMSKRAKGDVQTGNCYKDTDNIPDDRHKERARAPDAPRMTAQTTSLSLSTCEILNPDTHRLGNRIELSGSEVAALQRDFTYEVLIRAAKEVDEFYEERPKGGWANAIRRWINRTKDWQSAKRSGNNRAFQSRNR